MVARHSIGTRGVNRETISAGLQNKDVRVTTCIKIGLMNKLTKEDLRFIDPIRNAIPIEFTWTPKMEILNPIRVQSRKVVLGKRI